LLYGGRQNAYLVNDPITSPLPTCKVCSKDFVELKVHIDRLTIKCFVNEILRKELGLLGELTIEEGGRYALSFIYVI